MGLCRQRSWPVAQGTPPAAQPSLAGRQADLAAHLQNPAQTLIVKRTFGWLSNYRRFAKDYEYHRANSEALILIAASKLMVARLAK